MSVLYLYALVGAAPKGRTGRGLGREPLEVLPGPGFHVVAGRMAAAPEPSASMLRRHDAVIRRIARTVDALLPVRFGSVVPDAATAARVLAARAPELAARLRRVRGHEQMTLRVFGTAPSGSAAPLAAPPGGVARPGVRGPGTRYIAARRQRHQAARAPELDPIRPLLADLVSEERVQRHATPPLLASVYHLVPRARRAQYRTRVAQAARRLVPLRLTISGPWPPYAFGADAWP
jgi:hypothetical protein